MVRETAARLRDAGVATDATGELIGAHRVLGLFPRAPRVRRTGAGWRLGTLVVTTEGALIVGATTTRAHREERVGYAAESARERDELRHAAFRGGFVQGATVHVGGQIVDWIAESAPRSDAVVAGDVLVLRPDGVAVRWAAGASAASASPIEQYLAERADLRIDPPQGAT